MSVDKKFIKLSQKSPFKSDRKLNLTRNSSNAITEWEKDKKKRCENWNTETFLKTTFFDK